MIGVLDKLLLVDVEAKVVKTQDHSQQLPACDTVVALWSAKRTMAVVLHHLFAMSLIM